MILLIIGGAGVLVMLILYARIYIDRVNIKEYDNSLETSMGSSHGGIFFMKPVLYLREQTNDEKLKLMMKKHDVKVKYLYITLVATTALILVLYNCL